MKLNRLLAIVTYLLNRDIVSGKHLAEKFEVSERTIQRDINSINIAGIPITSIKGTNGGYKIIDSYRVSKQTSGDNDIVSILLGLKGLNSAVDDKGVSSTLEKVISISPHSTPSNMDIDFSVAKENKKTNKYISIINEGIDKKQRIEFIYTNASNYSSSRVVEPILLQFKWYSWYLVAYCVKNNRYQIFKLIRMNSLKLTDTKFSKTHDYSNNLFDDLMNNDTRKYINILFKCDKTVLSKISEYLPNREIVEEFDDYYLINLSVPENEHMWFAILLSLGDSIEIIEPEDLKQRLISHSQKIIDKYKIPDR